MNLASADVALNYIRTWNGDMSDDETWNGDTASVVSTLSEEEIDQIQEILDESDEDEIQIMT